MSAVSSLGRLLQLGSVDENELYAAMDWLLARQQGIEQRLAKRHLHDNTLLLYDLTSTFFEGHTCPLARRGHSRDGKRGTLQIVFGLLCTADGCPIAVEVFEGSTGDPKTVAAQVDKIRNRFGLQRVVLVGDRGMLTGARIREDLKGVDGLRWITTLRAPTIRKLIKAGAVAQTMFDERDLVDISSPDYPGERLVVCRNPILAEQRRRKRQELLASTEKDLLPIVRATQRTKEPLRGAAEIGVRVGKVINGHKVGKHFITTITDDSFSFARDLQKIAAEAELDGLYIVRSNVEPELFDAEQTVTAYKDLAKVERAFRSIKTVDLKVRPIYHRSADRVRAHVFLCMLAYYVEWHMRKKLAPVLFDDHDRAAGEQLRESVVQAAQRSPAAHRKAASKRTDDGLPVHSFRGLMSELGTLTANRVRMADSGATFTLHSEPTALFAAALFRSAGGSAPKCSQTRTLAVERNCHFNNELTRFPLWNFGITGKMSTGHPPARRRVLSDRLIYRFAPRNESVHLVVREHAVDGTLQLLACRHEQFRLLRFPPELLDNLCGRPRLPDTPVIAAQGRPDPLPVLCCPARRTLTPAQFPRIPGCTDPAYRQPGWGLTLYK